MYRPQSQISRQRSTDIKDLQSRTKKQSNKHYKQYVRKLIQNTPNHIDSDRRLKIQNSQQANRCEIRQRIEKKMGQDDKDMFRSAVVRFIKPKVNQRDYKRFKRLFEIFNKLQKTRNQIMTISCSSTRYIKEGTTLYQNERLKELKENMLKLQKEQETILMEIQNQGKENHRVFEFEKAAGVKQSYLMETNLDHNVIVENEMIEKSEKTQKNAKNEKCGGSQELMIETIKNKKDPKQYSHKRQQSQLSKKPTHSNTQSNILHLIELYELILSLDYQIKQQNSPDKRILTNSNYDSMYQQIKKFMINKQNCIDELFRRIVGLNRINRNDSSLEGSSKKHHQQINKPYEQVYKSSIKDQFGKFHELDQKAKSYHNQLQQQKTQHQKRATHNSFNFLLTQLESDLNQLKQSGVIKERNNQLARQLLTVSKELKKSEEEKHLLERELRQKKYDDGQKKQDEELVNIIKKENELMVKKNEKLDQDNTKLVNEIGKMKEEIQGLIDERNIMKEELQKVSKSHKESSKFEKYYRECLTLQQEVKILSEQNQKLVNELKLFKDQQQESTPHSEQKKLIKQKQPSSSCHQKSVKQSTSLIFKQLQKKNKKLSQENVRLLSQLAQVNSRINEFQKSQQSLINKVEVMNVQNKVMNVQNSRLKEDNKFLEQENNVLLEENKKIEEEFQYIVKEKLQMEESLGHRTRENEKLIAEKEKLTNCLRENISEMQQTITELKEHKQSLSRQMNHLSQSVKQMFSCVKEQITSALSIFINNLVSSSQESQYQEQKIIQSIMPSQQTLNNLTQQYQKLMDELNHCVYELNTYKTMLDQVTIQKELQKKYLEEQIDWLKAKLLIVERENARIKLEITQLTSFQEKTEQKHQKAEDKNQKREDKHYDARETQTLSPLLEVSSHQGSFNYMFKSTQKENKLKINCESFSINIPSIYEPIPTEHTSSSKCVQTTQQTYPSHQLNYFNPISISIDPHHSQLLSSQQFLTFQSWIQQVNLDSQISTSIFKSFCQINLTKKSSFFTSHQQNTFNLLIQENKKLKLQIEKLTLNEERSPMKDILSPNDKIHSVFDNNLMKDEEDEKLRIMGSLYNRFSFPKLQHHQGKQQNISAKENIEQHSTRTDVQSIKGYPPLQQQQSKIRQSLVQMFNKQTSNSTNKKINNQNETKLPTNFEEEDESFDLNIA